MSDQDQQNEDQIQNNMIDYSIPPPIYNVNDNSLEASEDDNYQQETDYQKNDDQINKDQLEIIQQPLRIEAQMEEHHAEIKQNFSQCKFFVYQIKYKVKREYISDYVQNIQQLKWKSKQREITVILFLILLTTMLGFIFHQSATILSGIFNLIILVIMFYQVPKLPECYANISKKRKKLIWKLLLLLIAIFLIIIGCFIKQNICQHTEKKGEQIIVDYSDYVFGITKFIVQAISGFIISIIFYCPIMIKLKKRTLQNLKNKEQEKVFTESFSENNNQNLEQMLTIDALQEEEMQLNCMERFVKRIDSKWRFSFLCLTIFILIIIIIISLIVKDVGPLLQIMGYAGILEIIFSPMGLRFFNSIPKLHKFIKESTFISLLYFIIAIAAIIPSSQFSYACGFSYYGDMLQGVFAVSLALTIKQFFLVKWKRFYQKKKNWEDDVGAITKELQFTQAKYSNFSDSQ